MRPIAVATVPHDQQRYETCGDWFTKNGIDFYSISAMKDWRYEFLVLIHEMVEKSLCEHRGISEEVVTAFDTVFERVRGNDNDAEPGDDPEAPYRREHREAENVERIVADLLGVDWHEYDKAVGAL